MIEGKMHLISFLDDKTYVDGAEVQWQDMNYKVHGETAGYKTKCSMCDTDAMVVYKNGTYYFCKSHYKQLCKCIKKYGGWYPIIRLFVKTNGTMKFKDHFDKHEFALIGE
jgi:hypothetical protein